MSLETCRDGERIDDWVAPVVKLNPLREQFGAEAVAVALDRVDLQLFHRPALPVGRTMRSRPLQRPLRRCRLNSSSNASRVLRTNRETPSGWRQAPRAVT